MVSNACAIPFSVYGGFSKCKQHALSNWSQYPALSIVKENNIVRTSTSGSSNGKSSIEAKPRTFLKKTRAIEQWRHKVGIQKFPGLHEWWQVRSISDLVGQDLVKVEVDVNRRNLQYSNDPTFPPKMSSRVNSPPSALKNTLVSPIYLCWFVLTHLTNHVWDIWLYPFERIWWHIYIYDWNIMGISNQYYYSWIWQQQKFLDELQQPRCNVTGIMISRGSFPNITQNFKFVNHSHSSRYLDYHHEPYRYLILSHINERYLSMKISIQDGAP